MRALALVLAVWSLDVYAKDDTPNASELALAHPWHALEPSTTAIAIECGAEVQSFQLDVDDRGWLLVRAKDWEALSAPFGRFLKTKGRWSSLDMKGWLTPRTAAGLSLRELAGTPILPEGWRVERSVRMERGVVAFTVVDQTGQIRAFTFDVLSAVWTALDELIVLETERFGARTLPAKIRVSSARARQCLMRRQTRAAKVVMPSREEVAGFANSP